MGPHGSGVAGLAARVVEATDLGCEGCPTVSPWLDSVGKQCPASKPSSEHPLSVIDPADVQYVLARTADCGAEWREVSRRGLGEYSQPISSRRSCCARFVGVRQVVRAVRHRAKCKAWTVPASLSSGPAVVLARQPSRCRQTRANESSTLPSS